MKRFCCVLILTAAAMVPALSKKESNPFLGRWDLEVTAPNAAYPGWMEVTEKDGALHARVQPRGGSARTAEKVSMDGSRLTLVFMPLGPKPSPMTWEANFALDRITGSQKRGDTVLAEFTGMRAPAMKRKAPKAWTAPESLFNGKDLTGWEPDNPAINHWVARDGVLLDESKGANLKTTRAFDDFKLHIEFNCPDDGNSGVYLRGRYEIQVEYVPPGIEDKFHIMGSIYGLVAPSVELPRKPGQWENFDVTLVGRWVTVVRNSVTTIDNQEIPGITGGALDSKEGQPGPFYLQGDHTGGMMYRNITIALPKH